MAIKIIEMKMMKECRGLYTVNKDQFHFILNLACTDLYCDKLNFSGEKISIDIRAAKENEHRSRSNHEFLQVIGDDRIKQQRTK